MFGRVLEKLDTRKHKMNDFEIDGLLKLSVCLFSMIPSVFLVTEWTSYWNVLYHYLKHTASTVRQTASNLFLHLIKRGAKKGTKTLLLGLVTQSVASEWFVMENENQSYPKINMKRLESDVGAVVHSSVPILMIEDMKKVLIYSSLEWEGMEVTFYSYFFVFLLCSPNVKFGGLKNTEISQFKIVTLQYTYRDIY